jgi:signal transduction histidine kinase
MTKPAPDPAGRRLLYVLVFLHAALTGAKVLTALVVIPNYIPVVALGTVQFVAAAALLALQSRFHKLLIPYLVLALAATTVEIYFFYPFFLSFGAMQSLFIMLSVISILVAIAVSCGTRQLVAAIPCALAVVSLWLLFDHIRGEAAVVPAATYLIALLVGVLTWLAVRLWNEHERLAASLRETERLNRRLATAGARIMEQRRRENLATVTAGIAHEINNPVTYLSGNMQFLEEHVQNLLQAVDVENDAQGAPVQSRELREAQEEVPDILRSFRTGVTTIHEVVRRLQSTFKNDRREAQVVNLRSILQASLKAAGVKQRSAVSARMDVADNLSIIANPADLYTVFVNILRNAVEVMDAEGEIAVWAAANAQGVEIRIEDSGPGIPPDVRERVFDPFFSSKSTHDGMGIGLALCRLIVEQQGGAVWVAEAADLNTCIALRLPHEPRQSGSAEEGHGMSAATHGHDHATARGGSE